MNLTWEIKNSYCETAWKVIKLKILLSRIFQSGAIKRLIPLMDRVLVQRAEALTKTAGGIVIPEKALPKVLRATVIAVGPGARNQVRNMKKSLKFINLIN